MAEGTTPLKGAALNRSLLVRIGKRLRKRINPAIRRRSLIGDAPVFHNTHFPWIASLEASWEDIRDEALAILKYRDAIPFLSELSPDHRKLDDQKKWRAFFLWGYGYQSKANCARCPKTTALVSKIPGLRTAMFSIHEPGMRIAPHKGVTAGICVGHLGLQIPAQRQDCAIRIADQVRHWENGKAFVFDDTYKHETWNNTSEPRIILLLHFDRAVRFPGNLLAGLFMAGIRLSPFVGDVRRQMDHWETILQDMERTGAAP